MVEKGVLTIESIKSQPTGNQVACRGITIPKVLNEATGVESTWGTGFNDHTWGNISRSYAKQASKLDDMKKSYIDAIIREAQAYMQRPRVSHYRDRAGGSNGEERDEREFLVDGLSSDSDERDDECKLSSSFNFFPFQLTLVFRNVHRRVYI